MGGLKNVVDKISSACSVGCLFAMFNIWRADESMVTFKRGARTKPPEANFRD